MAPSTRVMTRSVRMNVAPAMVRSARAPRSKARALRLGGDRSDRRGRAETKVDVEDVRAHDVAHRDVGVTAQRGDHARHQLGQRRPDRHDGQPHQTVAHAEGASHPHGPSHEQLPSHQQHAETEHCDDGRSRLAAARRRARGLARAGCGDRVETRDGDDRRNASRPHHPRRVPRGDEQQASRLQRLHRTVERQQRQERRAQEQHRELAPTQRPVDARWLHERSDAEDETNVGDVRADDVAHRDVAMSAQRRLNADDDLGSRGAIGDHREPDDHLGDAQRERQARCPGDEPLGAKVEQQAPSEKLDRDHHGWACTVLRFRPARSLELAPRWFQPARTSRSSARWAQERPACFER
jgi:hypothetical protein